MLYGDTEHGRADAKLNRAILSSVRSVCNITKVLCIGHIEVIIVSVYRISRDKILAVIRHTFSIVQGFDDVRPLKKRLRLERYLLRMRLLLVFLSVGNASFNVIPQT